jgi:hypothetical protein
MKSVIYKYVLDFDNNGVCSVEIPNTSKFLKLGVQDNRIVLWYLIDVTDSYGHHKERFQVIMTGEQFNDEEMKYIDTVTVKGWIVCHVFMKK